MRKWIFNKCVKTWTGLSWLRTGMGGRLLWMLWWTFGFHKMWRIYRLAEDLLASHEQLCSMELFGMHIPFVIIGFQSWLMTCASCFMFQGAAQLLISKNSHFPLAFLIAFFRKFTTVGCVMAAF